MLSTVVGYIPGAQLCSRFKYPFNVCFILLGLNTEGLCFIESNATMWRASCVIIHGIWNDARVFLVGAGTLGSSYIIIGWCGVCVGVGVWIASNLFSSSDTSGKLSACMGCRRGERCLGYRLSVFLLFLFSRGLAYH